LEAWARFSPWRPNVKTYVMKRGEIAKDWLVVDATDIPLGRLASRVATLLRGKHKPQFTPSLDMGDNVIVVNAAAVKLTGQKLDRKSFLRYSGYMGGQRARSLRELMAARPEKVVTMAVRGMLPKSRLGRRQLTHLRVYAGAEHPHAAQQPRPVEMS
jgi:large subunit ribosomal protein L13